MNIIMGIVLMLCGAFVVVCCVFNFEWYFNTRKARRFVNLVGRTAARIVYGVVGFLFVVVGLMAICYEAFV